MHSKANEIRTTEVFLMNDQPKSVHGHVKALVFQNEN